MQGADGINVQTEMKSTVPGISISFENKFLHHHVILNCLTSSRKDYNFQTELHVYTSGIHVRLKIACCVTVRAKSLREQNVQYTIWGSKFLI